MTKKEKKELALKLKAEIGAKHGTKPKTELTPEEMKKKKQHELQMRDSAKFRRTSKNQLGNSSNKYKWMDFDKW